MNNISLSGVLQKSFDRLMNRTQLRAFESFSLEIDSQMNLTVIGCREIKTYDEDYILLDCTQTGVKITGHRLIIKVFSTTATIIGGNIETVTFI